MELKLDALFNQWLKIRVSFSTEQEALKAVERNGDALRYVKDQTENICLKAVESDGDALQYVKDQTENICLKAVESDGDALQYVKETMFEHLLNPKVKILTKAEIAKKLGITDEFIIED